MKHTKLAKVFAGRRAMLKHFDLLRGLKTIAENTPDAQYLKTDYAEVLSLYAHMTDDGHILSLHGSSGDPVPAHTLQFIKQTLHKLWVRQNRAYGNCGTMFAPSVYIGINDIDAFDHSTLDSDAPSMCDCPLCTTWDYLHIHYVIPKVLRHSNAIMNQKYHNHTNRTVIRNLANGTIEKRINQDGPI